MTFTAYETSSAQKRIFLIDALQGPSTLYNMPTVWLIEGALDILRLEEVFQKLVERHEMLRTSFVMKDGEILQKVFGDLEFYLPCIQRNELLNNGNLDQGALERVIDEFVQPFDLQEPPLWRAALYELAEEKYLFLVDLHHSIADGVSVQLILEELTMLYSGAELEPLDFQYVDFTIWQNDLFQGEEIKEQEVFWLKQFDGEIPVLDLPTDFHRSTAADLAGSTYDFAIEQGLTAKLNQLAIKSEATLNMVLLAAYNLLLARYAGTEDIVVGVPVAGRPHAELMQIVGMFINSLPLRNKPVGMKRFSEFLAEVRVNTLEAFLHQDYQFDMLVESLGIQRDLGRNPLFDTMFAFQNMRLSEINLAGLKFIPHKVEVKTAKFELELYAMEENGRVYCQFEYRTGLFTRRTIERMVGHFLNILQAVTENPEIRISDVPMISAEERQYLIHGLNDTEREFPRERTVHQLFQEHVLRQSEAIALKCGDEEISYGELNARANRLAHYLRKKGCGRDKLVGILLERSPLMVECILAIWKAGGAYIPIDPADPWQRVDGLLTDSQALLLLTRSEYVHPEMAARHHGVILELDAASPVIAEESNANLELPVDVDSLAYVIYTSGSTGKPKGAMVEQIGMLNHMQAKVNDLQLTGRDVVAQNASHCFDISVWQFFIALIQGGRTVIYRKDQVLNPDGLIDQVIGDRITILEVVPTFLSVMLDMLEERFRSFSMVRYLLVTGETVKPDLVRRWFALYPMIPLVNAYGPTEASDDITHYVMHEVPLLETIPVGRPVQNFHIYIVDKYMNLCPIGVKGEICAAGVGVGRGYLNDPERTAKAFMTDPFQEGNVRLYKTGDLGRWLPSGLIEFFGRKDYQVKIRGFRIELGEIESKLVDHPQVKEAAVIDLEDGQGNKFLAAYLTVGSKKVEGQVNGREEAETLNPTVAELREYLAEVLPAYMIPAYFIFLERIPLNPNGKIDRKALPKITGDVAADVEYIAPADQMEDSLQAIWVEVLGGKRIGVTDNFFELGGHSLKATVLAARVNKELNVELPISQIFKTPTIRELANYLRDAEISTHMAIEPVAEQAYYPVSSAQKRLWVLNQFGSDNTAYNIPGAVWIHGRLDYNRLEEACHALIGRHEALRTTFEVVNGEPVQRIHSKPEFSVQYMEAEAESLVEVIKNFQQPFNLGAAPLLRVGVVKIEPEKHLFIFDMHHIISDGRSLEILTEDFMQLYEGRKLPSLRIQYKDFSAWQNHFFTSDEMKKQERYWLEQFSAEIPELNLTTDYPRPALQSYEGEEFTVTLDENLTSQLKSLANAQGVTLYMLLLAIYNHLLARYSGQQEIIIGTPIAGRRHVDVERMIGMFVNSLPLRNWLSEEWTFVEYLGRVKETILQAFQNQDYQFEMLVERLALKRDLSRNPLFDTMFSLQPAVSLKAEVGGLQFIPYEFATGVVKNDLALDVIELDAELRLQWQYSSRLFKGETIEQMARHFANLVTAVVANPNLTLRELEILSPAERRKLLYEWNETEVANLKQTVHGMIEEQVKRTPEEVALYFAGQTLTYAELNGRANQLARVLRGHGVESEQVVGLAVERSLEMVIGMLGVLKAGAAYLPIDLELPVERISYMLEEADVRVLLVNDRLLVNDWAVHSNIAGAQGELDSTAGVSLIEAHQTEDGVVEVQVQPETAPQQINSGLVNHLARDKAINVVENLCTNKTIINLNDRALYTGDDSDLEVNVTPENLAYVLYTSGTTGRPKGVMVEHHNVTNLLIWFGQHYKINPDASKGIKNCLQITSLTFDPSVEEIFGTLAFGGTVYAAERKLLAESAEFQRFVEEQQIQLVNFIPGLLKDLLSGRKLSSLEVIISGGERLEDWLKDEWIKLGYHVCNHYGPTETTVDALVAECALESRVTLGRPIANVQCYVLDALERPQPIGVPGELCIAGRGLARGYLRQPTLTAERFVPNPFVTGEKMYKTGDLVKWLSDGTIQFLGRQDQQVKIHGYRIELSEIECALTSHPAIHQALVQVHAEEELAAYVVGEADNASALELRAYLAQQLPYYMLPVHFVFLKEFPLLTNGKIDRKALPSVDGEPAIGLEYAAPTTVLEEQLTMIWASVLGRDKVGVLDNFFALGGHSLKATQVVSMVHKECGVAMTLRDIFSYPTIRTLAEAIQTRANAKYTEIEPLADAPYYELSYAQQRLWILHELDSESSAYNMPGRFTLFEAVLPQPIEQVFNRLINRHESLRTYFSKVNGRAVQVIEPVVTLSLDTIDLSQLPADEKQIQRDKVYHEAANVPFNLSEAPLFRVKLLKLGEEEYDLIYVMHHIITDGWSMDVLTREFFYYYEEHHQELPPLRVQYKDFARWQNRLLSDGVAMEPVKAFWVEQLSGELPVLRLPYDRQPTVQRTLQSGAYRQVISAELAEQLRGVGQSQEASLFMVLLAGFNLFLARITSQQDVMLGIPAAGREHENLQGVIGFFINTLILKNTVDLTETFEQLLQRIQSQTVKALEYQSFPLEMVFEEIKIDYPQISVFFNMLNLQDTQVMELHDMASYHLDEVHGAKFDLNIYLTEYANGIELTCHYLRDLFKPETVEYLMGEYLRILEKIVAEPSQPVKEYLAVQKRRKLARN